jgi:hypothetical protein
LVQAFLKKWWVESDFKAPNLPLSLRLKVSGCHYNSIYNNTWTKQVKQLSNQRQTQWNKCQTLLRHTLIKKYFWHFCWHLNIFTIWKSIVYNLFCRDGIYFDKILYLVFNEMANTCCKPTTSLSWFHTKTPKLFPKN